MTLQQKTEQMIDIFSAMNEKNKWTDDRVLMMAASVYVVKGKAFEAERYHQLCEYIKNESGVFSYLRQPIRFTVAAWLDTRFDNPEETFHQYNDLYNRMIEKGFKRNNFTYIAALALLQQNRDEKDRDAAIQRSMTIYERMKGEHPFITSKDDYPLAVILSQQEGEVDELIERMETFYRQLSKNGFWNGNNLQFLSQMLSLDTEHDSSLLIERTQGVFDDLKRASMKPKTMHYPDVGILALVEGSRKSVDDVRAIRDYLNKQKKYRWHRDLNYKLAVQLVVSEALSEHAVAEAGLFTSMEVIMQAQQTAIMAGSIGAVAAADGGGA